MPTYTDMCDRRAAAVKENAAMLAVEQGEDPKILTDEEEKLSNALEAEIELLSVNIKKYEEAQIRADRQRAREQTLASTTRLISTTPATPNVEPIDGQTKKLRISFPRTYGRLQAFTDREKTLGQNADDAYKSGQFLLAVTTGNAGAQEWCRTNGVQMLTAQSEDSNQMGGFLVPPEFETAIIDLRETYGVARRECKIVPMGSDTKTVPRRVSGLTAYYVGENTEITESSKKWDQVQLVAKKLGVLSKYSSEINEDSIINLADDLAKEMAAAFALEEDQALFLGAGAATHGGVSGLITQGAAATASVHTPVAGNSAYSTLDLGDFESMIGKLPQYAEAGAKWYISKAGWAASMLRLIDAAGGNTGAMIAGTAPKEFLGYPVVVVQVMNSTLTAQTSVYGCCYLGNLQLATTFGSRRGITVKVSDQRYFELDQIGIMATQRFALNVHDVGSTTVAGPVITLRMSTT